MKTHAISPQAAEGQRARVHAAPMLMLMDEGESRYLVKRVGFLPPLHDPTPFFETVGGDLYRLPHGVLTAWALDLTGAALMLGSPFPCPVRFGLVEGRPWVELD